MQFERIGEEMKKGPAGDVTVLDLMRDNGSLLQEVDEVRDLKVVPFSLPLEHLRVDVFAAPKDAPSHRSLARMLDLDQAPAGHERTKS